MIAELQTYQSITSNLRGHIHSDRWAQFVDRLSWDLRLTGDRMEVDEYDDDESEYLVIRRNEKHLASCRLRSVNSSTMVIDHFSEAFPGARSFMNENSGSICELTRFLRSPSLVSSQAWVVLKALGENLETYRQRRHLTGFVAVVFHPVSRLLKLNGVNFTVLEVSQIDGKRAELIFLTNTIPNSRIQDLKNRATCRIPRDYMAVS